MHGINEIEKLFAKYLKATALKNVSTYIIKCRILYKRKMTQNKKLLLFITLLMFISINSQVSKTNKSTLPDWRKETFEYAKQTIPSKTNNSNSGEEIPLTLKKAYITKIDNNPVVLAICALDTKEKDTSSFTYFFISPETNQKISEFWSVSTVKGCDLTIPAFVIKDITGDKKDDFIFLELYNDKCSGNYWILSNFHQIKPKTTKNELDFYLKLRNDMRINRKIKLTEAGLLQKS